VAYAGLRLEVLGNYKGNNGLKLGDFPEIEINDCKVEFKEIPTMILVRSNLSKNVSSCF